MRVMFTKVYRNKEEGLSKTIDRCEGIYKLRSQPSTQRNPFFLKSLSNCQFCFVDRFIEFESDPYSNIRGPPTLNVMFIQVRTLLMRFSEFQSEKVETEQACPNREPSQCSIWTI